MTSFVQLFVIAAAIATVCGESLPVSSSSRDYFLISQRELLHEIEAVEFEIASVNDRYADRLNVITLQQQQLLKEIVQTNRTLMPLQALSVVRKQCIQKYDSELVTYDTAKYQLKLCYDKAAVLSTTLTANAQTKVKSAKSEAGFTLTSNAESCDKSFPNNETALQSCYIEYVESATDNVNYLLNAARNQLDQNLYDSSVTSKTAVQCSFLVEKNTLETIGRTTTTIDDCEVSLNKQNAIAVLNSTGAKNVRNLIMGKITGQ